MLDACPKQQCYVKCHPHPPAQPFINTDVRKMEIGEGCDVGNDLDRGRAEVVVDDVGKNPHPGRACVPSSAKQGSTKPTTRTLQQHLQTKHKTTITQSIRGSSGTQTRHHRNHAGCPRQYSK